MDAEASAWHVADPFDLPEWLGEYELTWRTDASIGGPRCPGILSATAELCLPLLVLGADTAFPQPVVSPAVRTSVHQAWTYSQVAVLSADEPTPRSYALAVPSTSMDVDLVCTTLRRFAKAIGIAPSRVSVHIRL